MENNQPKISVIVPVYNAENSLHRCLDSILNQTLQDLEVLLINDGSTDKSGSICDQYVEKDKRVRVFHKENGGVSSARNIGLKNMRGRYSIHCDSDDWVEKDMLYNLYKSLEATNADILICDFYTESSKGDMNYCIQKPRELTPTVVCEDLLLNKIHGSTCNKLIRNSFIYEANISFNEEVNYCEDLLFIIELLINKPVVTYLNQAYYYYLYHSKSITKSNSIDQIITLEKYVNTLKAILEPFPYYKRAINIQILNVKIILLNNTNVSSHDINKMWSGANKYLKYLDTNCVYKICLFFVFKGLYIVAGPIRYLLYLRRKMHSFIKG